jgi:putative heme-binding domain-containing protein
LTATHADDFLISSDPWFRAVSIEYGPDGDVYVTDWSDLGECHDREGVHRTSGRIYKITWGKPRRVDVNLAAETDQRLVELQLHENDWFVRHARRLLQERAAAGKPMRQVHQRLHDLFRKQRDVTRKLRAMWALHVTGGLSDDWLIAQLTADDEHIRAWATRLLVDRQPVRTDVAGHFLRLAGTESAWLVRMELASALQRLPHPQRLPIAQALAAGGQEKQDPNLMRMVWYGIEPAVAADSPNAVAMVQTNVAPKIRRLIARRIGDMWDQSPDPLEHLFSAMRGERAPDRLADLLGGLNESLIQDRRRIQTGPLNDLLTTWIGHPDPRVRLEAVTTAMILGDDRLVEEVSELVHDQKLDEAIRRAALEGLIARGPRRLANDLRRLITSNDFVSRALRATAAVDDPQLIRTVLARYDRFEQAAKSLAVDATIARPASASLLLDAIENKRIPVRDISADQARHILALNNAVLAKRLDDVWGSLNSTPKAKRQRIAALKRSLSADFLLDADLLRGRALFTKRCAACHRLFGEGQTVAPDLTGSGRRDIDYLLNNIVDPNAVIPADFRVSVILLDDGRLITGSVISSTERRLTVQTRTESVTILRTRIETIKTLPVSLMPEELFKDLALNEVRDLVGYLMSDGLKLDPPADR